MRYSAVMIVYELSTAAAAADDAAATW